MATSGTGTCESCGRGDEELAVVQRYYLTPATPDTPASARPGDVERWCLSCRAQYPHEELGPET